MHSATRVLLLLIAVAGAAFPVGAQHPLQDLVGRDFQATVLRVGDGDTFDVVPLGEQRPIRLRLYGVDTPERGEPFSTRARNHLRTLISGKEINARGHEIDAYGRLVSRIFIAGRDVSAAMLKAGLACHFLKYSSDEPLALAQRKAQTAGAGFWAAGAEKPNCALPTREPGFYGNTRSHLLHASSCRNAGCRNCTAYFKSYDEAITAGFKPAKDCLRR